MKLCWSECRSVGTSGFVGVDGWHIDKAATNPIIKRGSLYTTEPFLNISRQAEADSERNIGQSPKSNVWRERVGWGNIHLIINIFQY